MTSEELTQIYADQLAHRRAANCYDIYEAAELIALQLGLDESRRSKLQDDLGQAAFDNALTVRSPSGHNQYAPTKPPNTTYGFDALTTPDDVNQWATKRGFSWRWNLEHQATIPSPATTETLMVQEAQRGYILTFPKGQRHVLFDDLAQLIADAMWPDAGPNDDRVQNYGITMLRLESELAQAVKSGVLSLRDPLTLGPLTLPFGAARDKALVTVNDLCMFLAGRLEIVISEPADALVQCPAKPAPVADSEWKEQAKTRASQIIQESRKRDLYPNQENLGDQIAAEFRKDGIVGSDGKPLSGATIKRHALKGISSATGKQLSTTIGRGK